MEETEIYTYHFQCEYFTRFVKKLQIVVVERHFCLLNIELNNLNITPGIVMGPCNWGM